MRTTLGFVALLSISGCATTTGSVLSAPPNASHVRVAVVPPQPDCRSVGVVTGSHRASTFTTRDEYVQAATAAAMTTAGQRGANYLFMQPPQFEDVRFGTIGATVVGEAFWCPQIAAEAAKAEAEERSRAANEKAAREAAAQAASQAAQAARDRAAQTGGKPDDATLRKLAKIAENEAFAERLVAIAPNPPVRLGVLRPDDVRVMREFPTARCSPVGAREAIRTDGSEVRAINELREQAARSGANVTVLDPGEQDGSSLKLRGRFYACAE